MANLNSSPIRLTRFLPVDTSLQARAVGLAQEHRVKPIQRIRGATTGSLALSGASSLVAGAVAFVARLSPSKRRRTHAVCCHASSEEWIFDPVEMERDNPEQPIDMRWLKDNALRYSPLLIFASAFLVYNVFPFVAEPLSLNTFRNFDVEKGRPIADQVLISIVVPCLGILFATLSSATLSVLRSRQQDMRRSLRQESILLDTVMKPLRKLFRSKPMVQLQVFRLLEQYALCVVAETGVVTPRSMDLTDINIFDVQRRITSSILDLIAQVDDELIEDGNANRSIIFGRIVGYAQGLVNQIDQLRAARRATTTFTFPLLHWLILFSLAAALPSCALLLAATFKSTSVQVLEDFLVRILVGFTTAGPVALLVLLADLNEPYAGVIRLDEPEEFARQAKRLTKEIKTIEEQQCCSSVATLLLESQR